MNRLIVVSNRVSAPKARASEATQGGLASALSSALRKSGGMWFGWSGGVTQEAFSGEIAVQRNEGVTFATIQLEEQDVEEYYDGYANRTLWPLFHYRVDLAEFDRHFGEGYERVNLRFAETLAPMVEAEDLIWVHDYHLIPLGQQLRRAGVRNKIGFFLHIPWPPHGLMTALPFHRRLVRSMLEYDLIGFQTRESLESFILYLSEELGIVVEGEVADIDGRSVRLGAFPIGIDANEVRQLLELDDAKEAFETLHRVARGRKTLIGVDRLDYSKGIVERFAGYRAFLEANPQWIREVFLLQVAPLSREDLDTYARMRAELDELSGRINGAFAHVDWVPIHYVNQSYPRDGLMGLYRASDAALVTPLRDGMNLVSKEYVAAQDPNDPGVLILSRFAGAAEQLTSAILVNPHSREDLSEAIRCALTLPVAERRDRWEKMMESVEREDVHAWTKSFLEALGGTGGDGHAKPALTLVS